MKRTGCRRSRKEKSVGLRGLRLYSLKVRYEFRYKNLKKFSPAGPLKKRNPQTENILARRNHHFAAEGYIHLRIDVNSGIKIAKIFPLRGHWNKETHKQKIYMRDATTASRLRLYSLKVRCEFRYKTPKNFPLRGHWKKETHKQYIYRIFMLDATNFEIKQKKFENFFKFGRTNFWSRFFIAFSKPILQGCFWCNTFVQKV